MGPCQGRQCGPVVQALIAAVHGRPIETIPPMRVRPPLRALSVGDLARIARADSDEAY